MTTIINTINLLEILDNFVNEVNKTNSSNEKLKILKKYPQIKVILKFVNDSNVTFGVKSSSYEKYCKSDKIKLPITYNHLYDLLTALANRDITGDIAKESIRNFINSHQQYENIILKILDKNLKIRMNSKQINKVFPGLIPIFEVALAEKYDSKFIKKGMNQYTISRKLDGVRCICFYTSTSIKFYSRVGNEFVNKDDKSTLTKLHEGLRKLFDCDDKPRVLDGEICIVDKDGKEDFTSVMKEIRKDVQNPRYYLFDILTPEEFNKGEGIMKFNLRYNKLKMYKDIHPSIKVLEQIEYTNDNFDKMKKLAAKKDWEGLMIRKNTKYKSGRSPNLLKYKTFFDEEFTVTDIITGPFRVISSKNGLEETIETMTAVVIDYKQTQVGTGFSINERKEFYQDPTKIVGKKITVKYFSKTSNSLRFPVYVCVRLLT